MVRNIKRINFILKDKEKKRWSTIIKEFFSLSIEKKEFAIFYFGRLFYKKNSPSPHDFMNFREYRSIIYSEKLKIKSTVNILNNKLYFSLFCDSHSLPTPKIIGYNFLNNFFLNNESFILNNEKDFLNFMNIFFNRNKNINRLFIKPAESKGGKGIVMVSNNNIEKECFSIWETIKDDSYIFQEPIEQHIEISNIYKNSINTIRIETYIDKNNVPHILGGYMRFGSGKSYIDNVSSGGFMIPVDFKKGKLHSKGHTALINGSEIITKHPTTGFIFSNFKIPYINDAVLLCKKFATYIPNRIIGWDVAITPHGPIIIEGNHDSAIIAGEFSYGGYKNNPLFKEILSEI